MTPLGQLIEDVRNDFFDRHGVVLSYEAIAKKGGLVIGGKRVHQYATEDRMPMLPRARVVAALAKGLEVPYRVVLERALQSAGYVLPEGDTDLTSHRRIG
jgi:hypothetical protein